MAKKVVIFRTHETQTDFLANVLEGELNRKGVRSIDTVELLPKGELLTVVIVGDTETYGDCQACGGGVD